jgi:hypothetical protein
MINVTLNHGVSRSLKRDFPDGVTIGAILRDAAVRSALGLPENVVAVINGQTATGADFVRDGDTVVFERQAAAKAS